MQDPRPTRRQIVGAVSAAISGAVAGCAGGSNDDDAERYGTDESTAATSTATETAGATVGSTTQTEGPAADLDLREANVVGVAVESDGESYTFDVTLHHDDGEDGYANWWQVERLDGTRLGRRDLLHAHSQQPFTRSTTVDVPDEVACVAVRGHDESHGYGGRLLVVDLDSGETAAIDQGAEPRTVDASDCP